MKKRLIKSIITIVLLIVFISTPVFSSVTQNQTTIVQAATVKISAKKLNLTVGQSKKLKITGTKAKVKWSTSKKAIATVNSKGKVTAKKAGSTNIIAKVQKKTFKCKVTVKKKEVVKPTIKPTVIPKPTVIVEPTNTPNLTNTVEPTITPMVETTVIPTATAVLSDTPVPTNMIESTAKPTITPIPIPTNTPEITPLTTINPSTQPTETIMPEKDNFSILKKYILTYGKENTNGEKYITSDYDSEGFTTGVVYKSSSNLFEFLFISNTNAGAAANTALSLEISEIDIKNGNFRYIIAYTSGLYGACNACETLDTLHKDSTLNWTIEETNLSTASLKNIANKSYQVAYLSWDILLQSKMNLSMSDLGFLE